MGEVAQPPAVPLFVQEVEEGNASDVLSLNAQLPGERGMRYDLGQVVPCDAGGAETTGGLQDERTARLPGFEFGK